MTASVWNFLLDPLHGASYQFWSGIGSGSPILAALLVFAKHLNCHEQRCFRLGHRHPDHGLPACRKHYHSQPVLPDA